MVAHIGLDAVSVGASIHRVRHRARRSISMAAVVVLTSVAVSINACIHRRSVEYLDGRCITWLLLCWLVQAHVLVQSSEKRRGVSTVALALVTSAPVDMSIHVTDISSALRRSLINDQYLHSPQNQCESVDTGMSIEEHSGILNLMLKSLIAASDFSLLVYQTKNRNFILQKGNTELP